MLSQNQPTQQVHFTTDQLLGMLKTQSIAVGNLHKKLSTMRGASESVRGEVEQELLSTLQLLRIAVDSLIEQWDGAS